MATLGKTKTAAIFYLTLAAHVWLNQTLACANQPSGLIHSKISFANIALQNSELHFAYAGDANKPGLLFVHGTPGDWSAFETYLTNKRLQNDFFMVSVDRLGWGKSSAVNVIRKMPDIKPIDSFSAQAKSLAVIINQHPNKSWVIIGHSLGASIAPKVALLEPLKIDGLLLLAGTLDPNLGNPRWYNRMANSRLIKWLIPPTLKHSNDEIMQLEEELRKLENELQEQRLKAKVVVMQGMKDKLVSPQNSAYAKISWQKNFADLRIIKLADAGHFLPWRQAEQVVNAIYALTDVD